MKKSIGADPRIIHCEQAMNDCRHQARMCRVKGDTNKAHWYEVEADYYEEMLLQGEYYVKANTEEEAEEKHNQGLSKPSNNGMPIDVYDETIDKIESWD